MAQARTPRWIPLGWTAILMLALTVAAPAAPRAHANHWHVEDANGYVRHLNNMHFASPDSPTGGGGQDEQYCVESHDTSVVSHTRARDFVRQTVAVAVGDTDHVHPTPIARLSRRNHPPGREDRGAGQRVDGQHHHAASGQPRRDPRCRRRRRARRGRA